MGRRLIDTLRLLAENPAIAPPIGLHGLRLTFIPRSKLMILDRYTSVSARILRLYGGRKSRSFPD
jgi:hypothetical protein